MLAAQFFVWWYGEGWRRQSKQGWKRVESTSRAFSAPLLISTLFAPWRRIVTYPSASMQAKLQAVGDNMVSRVVGFTVRLFVLITAGIFIFGMSAFTILMIIVWPLIPPAIVTGIVLGIV